MISSNFTLLCCIISTAMYSALSFPFGDVTRSALPQLHRDKRLKYGGAVVADLDGDGWQDIIMAHHDSHICEIFFNQRNGSFSKSPWNIFTDIHGISPFRVDPKQRGLHFTLSRGGNFGRNPTAPLMFRVQSNRDVTDVTELSNTDIKAARGRGRSAVFLGLKGKKFPVPDLLYLNALIPVTTPLQNAAFSYVGRGRFKNHKLNGFSGSLNRFGTVTDVDGDGSVELVSFHDLSVHRVTGPFRLKDVSKSVLPASGRFAGTSAVAELDFDNDGQWDLFVARQAEGALSWRRSLGHTFDYLLRNVGGRYEDVSSKAGVPRPGHSSGVTVADFNNDGWIDILVTRFFDNDYLLLNNGNGSFRNVNPGFGRQHTSHGDMATAVDYDQDGRVDVVLSEGDWHNSQHAGKYRLMRNIGTHGSYLLIRVLNSPSTSAVSMNAVVKVFYEGRIMMRRVGSPGTAVSNSYIDLVHFGIGKATSVPKATVIWADGSKQTRTDLKANSFSSFGRPL